MVRDFIQTNKTLIGLILISFLVILYTKYTRQLITKNELIKIEGFLLSKPIESYTGGDMPNYFIHIKLKEIDKDFYLQTCGYNMVDKEFVLGLNSDERIVIDVKKNEYNEKNKLHIYSLSTSTYSALDIVDYNQCYINYWRYLMPISILLIILIAYRFIRMIIKYNTN